MDRIKNIFSSKKAREDLSPSEKMKQKWGKFFTKRQQKEDCEDIVMWLDSPIGGKGQCIVHHFI